MCIGDDLSFPQKWNQKCNLQNKESSSRKRWRSHDCYRPYLPPTRKANKQDYTGLPYYLCPILQRVLTISDYSLPLDVHIAVPLVTDLMQHVFMAVRNLKLLGGGQSEVQKGTLLLMMIWHQKKGTCSQKGHFFPRLSGGQLPPAPRLGTALVLVTLDRYPRTLQSTSVSGRENTSSLCSLWRRL